MTEVHDRNDDLDVAIRSVVADILAAADTASRTGATDIASDAPVEAARNRPDRQRRAVMGIAAALAAIGVAALVVSNRAAEPETDVIATQPSVAQVTTPTAASPAPTTAAPTTSLPPAPSTPPTQMTVAAVRTQQAAALTELPGIRFASSVSRPSGLPSEREISADVTVMADSSMQAVSSDGLYWGWYRPDGEIVQGMLPGDPDPQALHLIGNGPYLLEQAFIGHDPVELVTAMPDAVVENVEFDGRPAWQISWTERLLGLEPDEWIDQDRVVTVDVETGVVVYSEASDRFGGDGPPTVSSLTGLQVVDTAPVDPPGELPPGNDPQVLSEPVDTTATIEEARARFGVPLIVPPASDAGYGPITLDEFSYSMLFDIDEPAEEDFGLERSLKIALTSGFVPEIVQISAAAPYDLEREIELFTIVDGYQCADFNGDDQCDNAIDGYQSFPDGGPMDVETTVIEQGPLAGITAIVNPTGIGAEFGVLRIEISAATTERAAQIADNLIVVD